MTLTEDLTSQVDGVKTVFDISVPFLAGTMIVHHIGVRIRPGIEYEEVPPNQVRMLTGTFAGESLMVQFETEIEPFLQVHFTWPAP